MINLREGIVKHRKGVVAIVLLIAAISAVLFTQVGINYNIIDYLPPDSPSTTAMNLMKEEYPGGIPNARVMVHNITIPDALALKEKFKTIEGVNEVLWLDSIVSTNIPIEYVGYDVVKDYYKNGTALFTLTVDDKYSTQAVHEINEMLGEQNVDISGMKFGTEHSGHTGDESPVPLVGDVIEGVRSTASNVAQMAGMTVSMAFSSDTIEADLVKVLAAAVPLVLIVLILTTTSWIEPILFLFTIGVAVVINMGTNIIFGEISFITQGIAALLQLAIAIDYAIFLLHRYNENRKTGMEAKSCMVLSMKQAATSIWASGVTAALGFVSLMVMRFQIGPDIGWVMVKGIFISLLCVFTLLPALTVCCTKLIEKTHHRSFIPDLHKPVQKLKKFGIPAVIIMMIIFVPCVIATESNHYIYADVLDGPDTQIGQDKQAIKDTFGDFSTMVLMVPNGNPAYERAMIPLIENISVVNKIVSYSKTVGTEIPQQYPNQETISKLISANYTRFVITVNTPIESDEAFAAVESLRAIGEQYYPGTWALAGEIVNGYDMRQCVLEDDLLVNIVSIGGIFIVLMLIFRSLLTPVILLFAIESAIWINCGIPYFLGQDLFYFARMIIFALQLAATVDYGILIADRYFVFRKTLPKHEAMTETLCTSSISVLTSAVILFICGLALAFLSSNVLLSALGVLLTRGALLSIVAALFVLPTLLVLLDKPIQKLTLRAKFVNPPSKKHASDAAESA
ncbi:MAG TPA: MMPL family transporter [Methanocorpusculum sp.]|nr:MMPL family transporter [Methanocorpusculum sp.]